MRNTASVTRAGLFALLAVFLSAGAAVAAAITVDTLHLLVTVDPATCRWSGQVKGTGMRIDEVYFLPNNDPAGWKVASVVNNNDINQYGAFVTVTLRGTKPGELDFEYQLSASKTGSDILVSLGRSNHTGKAIELDDMDYFVSRDVSLGGTSDRWMSLGAQSRNRDYYELWAVVNLITARTYAVNHVIKDLDTGNSLLMGHVTTSKGASRFDVASGWQGKTTDRVRVRGYCSYKIAVPTGKSFPGEKLLIDFNTDALRAMEHQADLIAVANDIRLRQRRPIDVNDRDWVANDYSRFHSWMSGGNNASARQFFQDHGLTDFYWGLGVPAPGGSWGLYGSGGSTQGRASRINYPAECFLPIHTVKYGGERVIDFSNPLTIRLERERAQQWVKGHEKEGRVEMDFADWWDKWPGQYDPYMSALETYHASGTPWREAIDQKAPRMVARSNMQPIDHSYGLVDILRTSEDADGGYEEVEGNKHLLTESLLGSAIRFFYSGRVYWNDGDGFHIFKFNPNNGSNGRFNYGEAKVSANSHAIATNVLLVSEAFDEKYPGDRVELLKRISPPTMDVAYPVDLFVRRPAQVWNMPVERPFGKWSILAVFNYTNKARDMQPPYQFSTKLDAEKDLRLDPNKEHVVYEFWTKKLIGTFKTTFVTPQLEAYDCDVFSVVEEQDHPALLSTSRHIRQMAFDIKDMAYDGQQRTLRGISRAVAGDPYQLRIYVPDGFAGTRVELSDGLTGTMKTEGGLLTVDYTSSTRKDVEWKVYF